MKQVIREEGSSPIKIWTDDVEETAMEQLRKVAKLPFIARNGVAVMPDVHAGWGSTIGSVIATTKAIVPSAVGVDIGCGMIAARTSLAASDMPDTLSGLRSGIERRVPLGPGGAHQNNVNQLPHANLFHEIFTDAPQLSNAATKAHRQLGTLGSGNHFIEICLDEQNRVWVMLHSGSRGIGNMIGQHFITAAKRRMEQYYIHLPDADLAYLPDGTKDFDDYVKAVSWAQDYAMENRSIMLTATIAALREVIGKPFDLTQEAVNCHHNYVARENHFGQNLWVTRKGAIRAREGDHGIIPGSMGQCSYIVRGKGNAESYQSCSHGAGRRMSRSAARKQFSVDDLIAQTEGVECRKDGSVLDEIPAAYKEIDQVMANQIDLVEPVHRLKQILCVKGG